MKKLHLASFALAFLAAPFVHAETIVNQGISASVDSFNGGQVATLHYEPTEKNVSAISFHLEYPKGLKVNTDNCLVDLPEGFFGGCRAVDGQVRVIIYSPSNEIMPAAIIGNVVFESGNRQSSKEGFASESLARDRAVMSELGGDSGFRLVNIDLGKVN